MFKAIVDHLEGLLAAQKAAKKSRRDTEHEDAALAMLPPVAGRRAA